MPFPPDRGPVWRPQAVGVLVLAVVLLATTGLHAQQPAASGALDRDRIRDEAVQLLSEKPAIALVHHIDVVPADARYWSVDPFAGVVRDGFVYGRGAIDMKGHAIVHLMAMLALKRSGTPLTRDILFIANSDEESGSTGAETFTRRHADLLRDVEYVITEGASNSVTGDQLTYYGVGVSEKLAFWQRLTVRGTPSHGSMPTPHNPVPRLIAALDRIARYETPLQSSPAVEKYFRDIAPTYSGEQRQWLSDVRSALHGPEARAWILSNPRWNAMLRNTISITGLRGSNKTNTGNWGSSRTGSIRSAWTTRITSEGCTATTSGSRWRT